MDSIEELNKDSIVIRGLDYDNTYEFRVVAVDGKHTTPSEVESIYTYSKVFKFRVIVTFCILDRAQFDHGEPSILT